jgi:hypothetical protein
LKIYEKLDEFDPFTPYLCPFCSKININLLIYTDVDWIVLSCYSENYYHKGKRRLPNWKSNRKFQQSATCTIACPRGRPSVFTSPFQILGFPYASVPYITHPTSLFLLFSLKTIKLRKTKIHKKRKKIEEKSEKSIIGKENYPTRETNKQSWRWI